MAKIIGNTTATPNPQPDWAQTDKTKADYIKNKPDLETRAQRLAEIDQADWEEDAVPQEWIDKEISKADFPYAVEGIGKLQKTKGSGYAYDFGRAYNRVYVERSGDGWGGHGGGQYAKFALTQDPVPVPDPDYKDWEKDENGNVIAPKEGKFNSSIPLRLPNSHIHVPANASAYNDRRQAMSLGCYEDKTKELKQEISEEITKNNDIILNRAEDTILGKVEDIVLNNIEDTANSVIVNKVGTLLVLDDIASNTSNLKIKTSPNAEVIVTAPNLSYAKEISASGSTSWYAAQIDVKPPKNSRITLSCDFENIGGTRVGIAIKPNGVSVVTEPQSSASSGSLTTTVDVGEYSRSVALRFYSNYSGQDIPSNCIFKNIVCSIEGIGADNSSDNSSQTIYIADDNGDIIIPAPEYSPVLVYSINNEDVSVEYKVDISKYFTTVENVTELPTININTNKIYNLYTATFIHNRHIVDNSKCYIVDRLPETGVPATDLSLSVVNGYYNAQDNEVYGYVDNTLSVALGCSVGWYPAALLLQLAHYDYAGIIDNIGKDPNDDTIRLLLEKKVYIYNNGWIEFTNSVIDERLPAPDAESGHWAYTVQRYGDRQDNYELCLISHTINELEKYKYQIPLRENGIIKVKAPVEDLDCANKAYVDKKCDFSSNLTKAQATQVAKINSTNASFDGTYDSLVNKAFIPTALSHLSSSANYRTVTDTEKTTWNNKLSQVFPGAPSSMGTKVFTPGWWTGYIEVEDAADTYMYRQYSLGTFYVSECTISNYRTCEVSVWNDRIKRRIEIDCNTGNWTPYNESGAVTSTALYAVKIQ
jgi:hypothetical protein